MNRRSLRNAMTFIASLFLFLLFPLGLAYAIEACNQPPALTASEIQLGTSFAETAAKAACKEIGADSTSEVVAIACDVVGQSRLAPEGGKMGAEAKPTTERRFFFVRRAEWLTYVDGGGR
jgi:hypothetical protein